MVSPAGYKAFRKEKDYEDNSDDHGRRPGREILAEKPEKSAQTVFEPD